MNFSVSKIFEKNRLVHFINMEILRRGFVNIFFWHSNSRRRSVNCPTYNNQCSKLTIGQVSGAQRHIQNPVEYLWRNFLRKYLTLNIYLKLVSSIFYILPKKRYLKNIKMVFISSEKLFSFSRYSILCTFFFSIPQFLVIFTVSQLLFYSSF